MPSHFRAVILRLWFALWGALPWAVLPLAVAGLPRPLPAQEADEDADDADADADAAADADDDADAAAPEGDAEGEEPAKPAERALPILDPKLHANSAERVVRAIDGRKAQVSLAFLRRLLELPRDEEMLTAMARALGQSGFEQLGTLPELDPEARRFSKDVLGVIRVRRLEERIKQGLKDNAKPPPDEFVQIIDSEWAEVYTGLLEYLLDDRLVNGALAASLSKEFGTRAFIGLALLPELAPSRRFSLAILDEVRRQSLQDTTVEAYLQLKPSEPAELLRAVDVTSDLGHHLIARDFLNQLMSQKLDQDQLAALVEKFGGATFLKMELDFEMNPESGLFAEAALSAVRTRAGDPKQIAALIGRLSAPAESERREAMVQLRTSGRAAVVEMIAVLGDAKRRAEQENVRTALVVQGRQAIGPLLGTLLTPDPALKAQAIEVLGRMRATESAPYLLAPAVLETATRDERRAARDALQTMLGRVPSRQACETLLYKRALSHYQKERPLSEDAAGRIELWHWDQTAKRPAMRYYTSSTASLEIASRLSRDLLRLRPDDAEVRRMYLSSLLESAAHQEGLDQPLPRGPGSAYDDATALGAGALVDLLEHAVSSGHTAAAAAAVRILGETGEPELVFDATPGLAALVSASQSGDRRLSFAAVEAVMKLSPDRPFPGSSHVVDALAWFAGSLGRPRALVADSRAAEASRLAGLLSELGWEVDMATNSRDFLDMASRSPDYGVALLDADLRPWPIDQVLQALRRQGNGSQLPVGLLASDDNRPRAAHVAASDVRTALVVRPQDASSADFQIGLVLSRTGAAPIDAAVRRWQTQNAIAWLAELSEERQDVYDLSRAEAAVTSALAVEEFSAPAAKFLGNLGTASGQRALVDLASQSAAPLNLRQGASRAFRLGVLRSGVQLTSAEILRQYERYNQSETQDRPTQELLGNILDAIEQGK